MSKNLNSLNLYKKVTKQYFILPFYHTVTTTPKPHISEIGYYRDLDDFSKDISFFKNNFKSTSIENLVNPENDTFHLSFDDGLSEIYSEVMPILQKNQIHATVFVNSDFVDNKDMFYRHKISLILNEIKSSKHSLEIMCGHFALDSSKIVSMLNCLTYSTEINKILNLLKIDLKAYLNEIKPYLTSKQLVELKKLGITIGNHSKNHPNFNTLTFQEQKDQVLEVNSFLQNELGVEDLYFSFPFGDHEIKNEFFEWMYDTADIKLSFGVSGIKKDSFNSHLHRIPMEIKGKSAEQIIRKEYLYYIIKAFLGKNIVKR